MCFRNVFQAGLTHNPAELDFAHAHTALIERLYHLAGYGQAHVSLLRELLVRNQGLPQGKTAVVCRNLGMQENPKAATPQLYHRTTQKVQVLETPAAQANPVYAVGCTNPAANFANCRAQSVMKACGNLPRSPATAEMSFTIAAITGRKSRIIGSPS